MATLYTIHTSLEPNRTVVVFADDDTPAGHFVSAVLHGTTAVFYLLRGDIISGGPSDYNAPIVGRLESPLNGKSVTYLGTELKGGADIAQGRSFFDSMRLILGSEA